MRCLQKRKWVRVKRNGRKSIVYTDDGFIFPYIEAEFLGIGTTQHWKNIKMLVEIGFLDVVHQGGWYQKNEKQKDYSVYKLSDRWRQYDTTTSNGLGKLKCFPLNTLSGETLKRKVREQLHKSEVDNFTIVKMIGVKRTNPVFTEMKLM